jgi:GTP-binding protein LepA
VTGLGRFRPRELPCDERGVGQVGYVIANIKRLSDIRIGDTITEVPGGARRGVAGSRAGIVYRL